MLDRQHGKIIFVCDDCGESLETGTGEFDDALAILRDERWQPKLSLQQHSGEWKHYCPDCKTASEFEPV
jgi:Fe2+ or Zn2+ uptake regulation protein